MQRVPQCHISEEMTDAEKVVVTNGHLLSCREHPLKGSCPNHVPLWKGSWLCQVVILAFSLPILQMCFMPFCGFSFLFFFFWPFHSLLSHFTSYPVSLAYTYAHTHMYAPQRLAISIGNEEEGIGIEPHAGWLASGWKANYSLFLTTTSDAMLFSVKALTGCTLNILAICPIRFCSPRLKPFKDSAACHFRADWLPNAHIWNTWFQY